MDIKVTDKDNTPLQSATVALIDKNGTSIFSVTTDANGNIAQQTVTRGTYDYSHDQTLQDLSPHTLTIYKQGYRYYKKIFTLDVQKVWEIKLDKRVW
jgi:hypothetical protein